MFVVGNADPSRRYRCIICDARGRDTIKSLYVHGSSRGGWYPTNLEVTLSGDEINALNAAVVETDTFRPNDNGFVEKAGVARSPSYYVQVLADLDAGVEVDPLPPVPQGGVLLTPEGVAEGKPPVRRPAREG